MVSGAIDCIVYLYIYPLRHTRCECVYGEMKIEKLRLKYGVKMSLAYLFGFSSSLPSLHTGSVCSTSSIGQVCCGCVSICNS